MSWQAVEKHPSAALRSSFVIAAYTIVRLIPLDFARLAPIDVFDQPEKGYFLNKLPGLFFAGKNILFSPEKCQDRFFFRAQITPEPGACLIAQCLDQRCKADFQTPSNFFPAQHFSRFTGSLRNKGRGLFPEGSIREDNAGHFRGPAVIEGNPALSLGSFKQQPVAHGIEIFHTSALERQGDRAL
jgi:hypothetical protein